MEMTLDQVDLPASQPNTIIFPSGHQTLDISCQNKHIGNMQMGQLN